MAMMAMMAMMARAFWNDICNMCQVRGITELMLAFGHVKTRDLS